jgi:hypothetical protein
MTQREQTTINQMRVDQTTMQINQAVMKTTMKTVQDDIKDIKGDLKLIKTILTDQKDALVAQREKDDGKYVTKKFVIMSMSVATTALALIAYFWQAYGSNHIK